MMSNHSDVNINELLEVFQLFDNRGDCKIDISQIGSVVRCLGQNPSESDVKKLIGVHKLGDRMNFDSFLSIHDALLKVKKCHTRDDFVEFFRFFDKDGNGLVSSAQLRYLLTTMGEKLTDGEVEELLTGHKDSVGYVNYEQFVQKIMFDENILF